MTLKEAQKKVFIKFRDWLKFWCSIHVEMQHIEYTNKRFYYGNNSYMDIGELLRENSGLESSPCVIYDTDIHMSPSQNKSTFIKHEQFYICVLTREQVDGDAVKHTKDKCEKLAVELIAWFNACKLESKKMVGYEIGNVDSTPSFLNGWEGVSMRVSYPMGVPCVDEHRYVLTQN